MAAQNTNQNELQHHQQRDRETLLDYPGIAKCFAKQLAQSSSLTSQDFAHLRLTNSHLNDLVRDPILTKIKKSLTINSTQGMDAFLLKCEAYGPDIVRRLVFSPSYREQRLFKLYPTICPHIQELVLNNGYDFMLDKAWEILSTHFTNLSALQLNLYRRNIWENALDPNLIQFRSLKKLTLVTNELDVKDDDQQEEFISFMQGMFSTLPNLKHLEISEVDYTNRENPPTISILGRMLEISFKALGCEDVEIFRHVFPSRIQLNPDLREVVINCIGLNGFKRTLMFQENGTNDLCIRNCLSKLCTENGMKKLGLKNGTEQMIPDPGCGPFGGKLEELKLEDFTGSIAFIQNCEQLKSITLIGINFNSQLAEEQNEEDEEPEVKDAIMEKVFGKKTLPNLERIRAYGCEGVGRLMQLVLDHKCSGVEMIIKA